MPFQQALTGHVFASIHEHHDGWLIHEAAGQGVFGILGETSVAAQTATLVKEMEEAWSRMEAMVHA